MTELEFVRKKYANKNIIEVGQPFVKTVLEWLAPPDHSGVRNRALPVETLRSLFKRYGMHGLKFLDEGVLVITDDPDPSVISRLCPFKFGEDGMLQLSIYLPDPDMRASEGPPISPLCKVLTNLRDWKYMYIEGTRDEGRYKRFTDRMFADEKQLNHNAGKNIKEVYQAHPDLKPWTLDWKNEVAESYFKDQYLLASIAVAGVNAFLVRYEKEVLVTRIEQKRQPTGGKGSSKHRKINPLYRYVVELPKDYKPRKLDLNYVMSEWERAGHYATRWVRPENAETLAKRKGGRVTDRMKDGRVAILIPIAPQHCHRRAKDVAENIGVKHYSTL